MSTLEISKTLVARQICLARTIKISPIIDFQILGIDFMSWKKGDVVMLVSGGPDMTVEEVTPDGEVFCVWFENKKVNRDSFDVELLRSSSPKAIGTLNLSR